MARNARDGRLRISTLSMFVALSLAHHSATAADGGDDFVATTLDAFEVPTLPRTNGSQATLVGLVLDERDVAAALTMIPAAPGQSEQVGVEALLKGLGLEPVHLTDGGWHAPTPLGDARLAPADIATVDGVDYASLTLLSRALGIGLRFDEANAAIVATTHWDLVPATPEVPPTAEVVRPEGGVEAPSTSLSYWRTEAYLSHADGDTSVFGATDVGGGIAGGFWRARYEDDLDDRRLLRDYAWVRTDGRLRWLLGHQQVNAHPLLQSIELTGAQMAWTNRPDRVYNNQLDYGELVSGRTAPASNLVGTGPVGGVAELRFDGIVVARVPVALDGRYEFRDIPLRGGVSTRVQVALYENGNLGVPVRIEDHSGQADDQLLPEGTVLHYLGAGRNGNPLDPDNVLDGSASFYEFRYGVLPGMTLDASMQRVDGRQRWLTGGVFSLGAAGVYSAHVASNGDEQAWQVDGEGFRGNAYWRLLAREEDDGFRDVADLALAGMRYERYAEAGWRGTHWGLSLVGRDVDGGVSGEPIRYVKPGVDWYPTQSLYFSAHPDLTGRYEYSMNWSMSARARFGAYLSRDNDSYEFEYRISDRWRGTLGRTDYLDRTRHSLLVSRDRFAPGDVGLTIAALESEGRFGYLAAADARLFPGVTVRLQVLDDPLSDISGPVIQLGLVADFAVTPEGLVANQFRRSLTETGGVAGALRVPGSEDTDFIGSGATVWIDGQRRTTVDENGRFNVGELSPGIHRVKVDEGALPIEMKLVKNEYWVEVRPGVITTVAFPLDVRVGFGGRLRAADGTPWREAELVIQDEAGAEVGRLLTDEWGYYRVDGLPAGRYRVLAADGTSLGEQWIELGGKFRFGVDLQPAATPAR